MTMEEVAEGYLNELINRNLVQVTDFTKDGRSIAYRIHGLWREMIIAKSREQNIVTITSQRGTTWPEQLRRLSIQHDLEDIQQSICCVRLRSLLVFEAIDPLSILSKLASLGKGIRLLTVLDLRGAHLETFPHEVLNLLYLTYLSLRETNIKTIPKSIGKLKKLETLDLKHTKVDELPNEILKLQYLRHLLLYRYSYNVEQSGYFPFLASIGFKAPAGVGSLMYLQKLCAIDVNQGGNSGIVLGEVGKLTQLRKLYLLRLQKEDGTVLCSSLEKLNNLRSLDVTAAKECEIIDLDSLSLPPRLLRTLFLKGRLETIPHWIPSLNNLQKLHLCWSKLKDVDPLLSLQDLPSLLFLELGTAYEGDGLLFKAGGFQKLKHLWLVHLARLKWVRVESSSMLLLEELRLEDCKLMTELPSGVEHLAHLKDLRLHDMSETLTSSLNRDLGGGDYWKIAHVPNAWVHDFRSGIWTMSPIL